MQDRKRDKQEKPKQSPKCPPAAASTPARFSAKIN